MTTYAKPYPDIQFVRKFFYLNHSWITFKKNLLKNIKADYTNREMYLYIIIITIIIYLESQKIK